VIVVSLELAAHIIVPFGDLTELKWKGLDAIRSGFVLHLYKLCGKMYFAVGSDRGQV
jgi:hypothetical protein